MTNKFHARPVFTNAIMGMPLQAFFRKQADREDLSAPHFEGPKCHQHRGKSSGIIK